MHEGVTRRRAIQLSAGSAMAAYLAACGGSSGSDTGGRLVFKTWEDHYLPQQLDEMRRKDDISVKVSFADDNLTNFEQLKRGAPFDVVTADALWVPTFRKADLVEAFDPSDFPTWNNLYSAARSVPFLDGGRSDHVLSARLGAAPLSTTTPPRSRLRRTPGSRCSTRRTAARSFCSRSRTTSWPRPVLRPVRRSRTP